MPLPEDIADGPPTIAAADEGGPADVDPIASWAGALDLAADDVPDGAATTPPDARDDVPAG